MSHSVGKHVDGLKQSKIYELNDLENMLKLQSNSIPNVLKIVVYGVVIIIFIPMSLIIVNNSFFRDGFGNISKFI